MTVQGTAYKIGETQTFGANGFRKRELVVETANEKYPQKILIEFLQDKSDLLNDIAEGEEVEVSINLGGREWVNPQGETKYFNSITGWRVEKKALGEGQTRQEQAPSLNEDEEPDLPF